MVPSLPARRSGRGYRGTLTAACLSAAAFTSRLPNVAFCSGLPFAAAMSAEPSIPRNAHDISSIMEGAMESAEYSGAVAAMSDIMANAEEDAREFVNEK
ncbi:unnamed protein product, partial [Symbiodinium sp. CCMP2592]